MCNVPCFQMGQEQLQCISRLLCFQKRPQQQLQCVNTLISNGPKVTVMYKHFSFKGSPNFTNFFCASFFNLGDRSFLWMAKWWASPIGGYGVRLIRLGSGAGNFLGAKNTLPEFPKFARKSFMRQSFCSCWLLINSHKLKHEVTKNSLLIS